MGISSCCQNHTNSNMIQVYNIKENTSNQVQNPPIKLILVSQNSESGQTIIPSAQECIPQNNIDNLKSFSNNNFLQFEKGKTNLTASIHPRNNSLVNKALIDSSIKRAESFTLSLEGFKYKRDRALTCLKPEKFSQLNVTPQARTYVKPYVDKDKDKTKTIKEEELENVGDADKKKEDNNENIENIENTVISDSDEEKKPANAVMIDQLLEGDKPLINQCENELIIKKPKIKREKSLVCAKKYNNLCEFNNNGMGGSAFAMGGMTCDKIIIAPKQSSRSLRNNQDNKSVNSTRSRRRRQNAGNQLQVAGTGNSSKRIMLIGDSGSSVYSRNRRPSMSSKKDDVQSVSKSKRSGMSKKKQKKSPCEIIDDPLSESQQKFLKDIMAKEELLIDEMGADTV